MAVFCLYRLLPQQLLGGRKSIKELVVQIVSVGNDHNGGVVHEQHDFACVKYHRQRLAAALRMPYHASFSVAGRLFFYSRQPIALRRFQGHAQRHFPAGKRQVLVEGKTGGPQSGLYGAVDGIILMISS